MPDPSHHENLPDELRHKIQRISAEFVTAWQRSRHDSGKVLLATFLPPTADPLRLRALHELIPIDLEQRHQRGEKVVLESYLKDFPELGAAADIPVELISAEYRIRRLKGEPLRIEDYRQRFPKQYDALLASSKKPIASPHTGTLVGSDLSIPTPNSAGTQRAVGGTILADSTAGTMLPAAKSTTPRTVMPVGEGYKLHECIGRGMFGEVWRAEAPGGVEVAVKMIHRTAGDQLTQMELRALELMKRLRHPFLVQVQAYWLSGDQLHIVMDLAEKTLLQRLEECQRKGLAGIPAEELLTYMHEAAEGLDFLHSNQVLHRDVKPANILLAKGHARLADFGLARLFMKSGTDLRATMAGTPLYMGPEVWLEKVGPESDQYSLAATYVELRSGRPLFEGGSQDEVKRSHLSSVPNLTVIPTAERKVLQKALAKKLEERFKNCTEFVNALDVAILGPSHKRKSWLTRRRALMLLTLGALTTAGTVELGRRQGWLRLTSPGMEVTAPSGISIRAGEQEAFEIHVVGARDPSLVKPEFTGLPEGARFEVEPKEQAANAQIWRVTASVDLNISENQESENEVTLRVDDGKGTAERTIQLTIVPPLMVLPPDCEPAPGAKRQRVAQEGANYWDRIVRQLPGDASLPSGRPCELVLIPYNSTLKLPSFYMLSNKVWNELFTVFNKQYVSTHPPRSKDEKTEEELDSWPDAWSKQGAAKGADDMPAAKFPLHPVMKVNFRQATEFAKWLSGALPTCQQWDTAAGLYLPNANQQQGPFLGEWQKSETPSLAIAIAREGTLAIDEANDDISPFGCRHMAGNGAEWTRDASDGAFSSAQLRGRQYYKMEPLHYSDLLEKDKQTKLESEDLTATSPYIGFRIVIELAPAAPN
jgi:serine/threonine protein kinase